MVTWHSFDLRSGRRGPQVTTDKLGTFARKISESTETSLDVRMVRDGAPVAGWEPATQPGRVMLVALDDLEEPIWGGMVYRRTSNTGPTCAVQAVTLEAYFDRRYVKDAVYTATDQGAIAQGLILGTVNDGITVTVDVAAGQQVLDREYAEADDQTVLNALQELAGLAAGIEFTVDLRWADDTRTVLERVVRVKPRLGTAAPTGRPGPTFSLPGTVTDFDYVEDYSAENGANAIQATSSAAAAGAGADRVASAWHVLANLVAAGWARFERKFSPGEDLDQATLDQHADAEVRQTFDGLTQLQVTAQFDTAPSVGRDWYLGDDLTVTLTCPRFPERLDADGARVAGYTVTSRAVAWEVDADARTIKPTLLDLPQILVDLETTSGA